MVWIFIIAPFIRLIRISRQWTNPRNQQQQQRQQRQRRRPQPQYTPKKKIDPTVGEYVEFTETDSPQTDATPGARPNTPAEPQITDVTWEDLPAK